MQDSRVAKSSEFLRNFLRSLPRAWRLLGPEQRVAAVGSLLLIVSTFGPFTFVEAAEILAALGVLTLLKKRAEGSVFHLPFGDGTVIAAAGVWCGLLILVRLFDRSLGQNLLALACATVVFAAGMRERAKRPMDDLPPETIRTPRGGDEAVDGRARRSDEQTEWLESDSERTRRIARDAEKTDRIPRDAEQTERLSERPDREPPPEPPRR
jgi:hypothetical protein